MSRVLTPDPAELASVPHLTDEERYRRAARRGAQNAAIARFVMWALLFSGAILFLLPFYVMVVMSLKTAGEVAATSIWSLPPTLNLENFQKVLTNPNAPFPVFLKNSAIITVVSTAGALLSSAMVAYSFARLRFPGRDRLFLILLATMMLPAIVTMVPTYVEFKYLRWIDTFLPLTVPAFFGGGAYN
ncbi:carbohydrate ABC transporter permease, partial [bacterium]